MLPEDAARRRTDFFRRTLLHKNSHGRNKDGKEVVDNSINLQVYHELLQSSTDISSYNY